MAAIAIGCVPAASANDYKVSICGAVGGTGITEVDESSSNLLVHICAQGNNSLVISETKENSNVSGAKKWTLQAPPGTKIHTLTFTQGFTVSSFWSPNILWGLFKGADTNFELFLRAEQGNIPPNEQHTYEINSESVTGRMICVPPSGSTSCANKHALATLSLPVAEINDLSPPTVSVSGSLLAGGPIQGIGAVNFQAADLGAGISRISLLIDGQRSQTISDTSTSCLASPYKSVTPCSPAVNSSFIVPTTPFTEGNHPVAVEVEDGSGQITTSAVATVDVHNRPLSTAPPALWGTAAVGQTMAVDNGHWLGALPTFAFQWLRCPADVVTGDQASCTPIALADTDHYTATADDIGSRIVAAVTANNASGVETALSAPSDIVPDQLANKVAPSLSGTASVGSQLQLDHGGWEDLGGADISFAHRWLRCPATVNAAAESAQCEPIAGATGTNYTLVKDDAGKKIMAEVTGSVGAPQALQVTATSAPTAAVSEPPPAKEKGGDEKGKGQEKGTGKEKGNGQEKEAGKGGSAPQTKISKHPGRKVALRSSNAGVAKFKFTADQPGAHFECRLDNGRFKSCRSPYKHKVRPGHHIFRVRAVSATGLADPTPAIFRWLVSR